MSFKYHFIVLLVPFIFHSTGTAQTSGSVVMPISVRVIEGFTATVHSKTMVLSPAPPSGRYYGENREQQFGTIGLKHSLVSEYILNYPEELRLVNHRGEQIRYSTTLIKNHNPGTSRCVLTLKGNRLDNAGNAGSFYGSMTVKITYL